MGGGGGGGEGGTGWTGVTNICTNKRTTVFIATHNYWANRRTYQNFGITSFILVPNRTSVPGTIYR